MKKALKDVMLGITYHFKILIIFELTYRALGLLLIFPLARLLFLLSIRFSGLTYITNSSILTYLTKPLTILVIIILLFILSIYMVIELIILSVIFDYGYHHRSSSACQRNCLFEKCF